MQKLLTLYLDNSGYMSGKTMITSYATLHGHVEEHLQKYLDEGWTIESVNGFGGGNEALHVRGWLAVVLKQ
jgi:hypothetical protein